MIVPCIDLMDGKVVQLVQGREKALEGDSPDEMIARFAAFPEIQVIDLDAALGRGSNDALVRHIAARAATRVGGGVRTVERAQTLVEQGARKVIVGTSAFTESGINQPCSPLSATLSAATASSSHSIPKAAASSSRVGRRPPPSPPRRFCARSNPTVPAFSAPMWIRRA